jgi:hypothetical protein
VLRDSNPCQVSNALLFCRCPNSHKHDLLDYNQLVAIVLCACRMYPIVKIIKLCRNLPIPASETNPDTLPLLAIVRTNGAKKQESIRYCLYDEDR